MAPALGGSSPPTPAISNLMRTLPDIQTLVVKLGSNILADPVSGISEERVAAIARTIAEIKKQIPNVVLVSSGAVAAGFRVLGYPERPRDITDKQACAAVGQVRLMGLYEREFSAYGFHAAQILITKDDFNHRRRYINARYSLRRLIEHGVVPVINENDSVVVDELKYVETFGDNDNLSALVAGLIDADLLLILSDVDGLYDKNPTEHSDARLIPEVKYFHEDILSVAGDSVSGVGTGGMKSKLTATRKALDAGCYVGILNGKNPDNIISFLRGNEVGTFFSHVEDPKHRKKLWLAYATIPKGELVIDDGAVRAITQMGKSLLPSGVADVSGRFGIGEVIRIMNLEGVEVARGKVRYSSGDMQKIKGKKSADIYDILGYRLSDVVVHRDDMVVSGGESHA